MLKSRAALAGVSPARAETDGCGAAQSIFAMTCLICV